MTPQTLHLVNADSWKQLVPGVTPLAVHIEQASYGILGFSIVVRVLFFWWLLSGERAKKIEQAVSRRATKSLLADALCAAVFALLYLAAGLPSRIASFVVFRHYGIIVQHPAPWMVDLLQGWGVDLVVAIPALILILKLQRRFPKSWWLPVTGIVAALTLLLVYAAPVVIDPLFHHFTPLHNAALRDQILALAKHAGVHVNGVYVGAFSATTTEGNAYVTGLGSSHRIVIWDTLLRTFPPGELRSIIAHELGHYALHHVLIGVAAAIGGSAFVLWVGAGFLTRLTNRDDEYAPGHAAALVPLAALVVGLNLISLPLQNRLSRSLESRADRFSLEVTRDPSSFIRAMQRLCLQDHSDPWPNIMLEFVFYTHPSISERIHAAATFAAREGLPVNALLRRRSGS